MMRGVANRLNVVVVVQSRERRRKENELLKNR